MNQNLWKSRAKNRTELNRLPSLAMGFTAPRSKTLLHNRHLELRQHEDLLRLLTALSTLLRRYLHTRTNGPSKRVAPANQTSKPGTIKMEKANCSVSTSLMIVERFVRLDSRNSVTNCTMFSKKAASTISQAPVGFKLPKSSFRISITTMNLPLKATHQWKR